MKLINKTLSPEEYLEEINLYFQDIINNKMSGTWEIQLLAEMDSILSAIDANVGQLMYSSSKNTSYN